MRKLVKSGSRVGGGVLYCSAVRCSARWPTGEVQSKWGHPEQHHRSPHAGQVRVPDDCHATHMHAHFRTELLALPVACYQLVTSRAMPAQWKRRAHIFWVFFWLGFFFGAQGDMPFRTAKKPQTGNQERRRVGKRGKGSQPMRRRGTEKKIIWLAVLRSSAVPVQRVGCARTKKKNLHWVGSATSGLGTPVKPNEMCRFGASMCTRLPGEDFLMLNDMVLLSAVGPNPGPRHNSIRSDLLVFQHSIMLCMSPLACKMGTEAIVMNFVAVMRHANVR